MSATLHGIEDRPLSVDRLPTLTEVLELGPELLAAEALASEMAEAELLVPTLPLEPSLLPVLAADAELPFSAPAAELPIAPAAAEPLELPEPPAELASFADSDGLVPPAVGSGDSLAGESLPTVSDVVADPETRAEALHEPTDSAAPLLEAVPMEAEAPPQPPATPTTLVPVAELAPGAAEVASSAAVPAPVALDIVAQVLAELQPQIDHVLDERLRDALAPALARVADGLIRDTRQQLAATLRDLVEEAVARTLRQRDHP